jgi:16S rRNA A1518/A1519 N6-dimethyltransferase RsmA/KsgA/DIM1 with predicted DNA glycosylase/AP lyase activity
VARVPTRTPPPSGRRAAAPRPGRTATETPARAPRRRKALGQHHLRDGRAARPLVDFLGVAGRTVLEIGPGGGALTRELLGAGARVAAVELDPAWAFELRARLTAAASSPGEDGSAGPVVRAAARAFWMGERLPDLAASSPAVAGVRPAGFLFFPYAGAPGRPAVALAIADALGLDWRRLPPEWRVAGNLPYQVGTAILERLLERAPAGLRAGFLLQREVVDRLVAEPGSPAYGALSVLVAARASVRRLGTLGPGAFAPRPQVESSFVGLELRPPPLAEERMPGLEALVRAAFAARRKTLRNTLGAAYGRERAEAALAAAGVAPGERAERLGLERFVELSRRLSEP